MNEYGYHLEAEYESGYVHSNQYYDVSPYSVGEDGKIGPNVFNDILHKRPENIHGKMKRFSLVGESQTYNIDWSALPDNARPIYFRDMQQERNVASGESVTTMVKQTFGYQYTDDNGKNVKEIKEITP